jgi:hypothetical protein
MPPLLASERSSAWLERQLWELDVAGSNPVAPTILSGIPMIRAADWVMVMRSLTERMVFGGEVASIGTKQCQEARQAWTGQLSDLCIVRHRLDRGNARGNRVCMP